MKQEIVINSFSNPVWWNRTHDRAWECIQDVFKQNWGRARHDLVGHGPGTNWQLPKAGKAGNSHKSIPRPCRLSYEELEPAYRFGYGARLYYGARHSEWSVELEFRLEADWEMADSGRRWNWLQDREQVLHGWDFATNQK